MDNENNLQPQNQGLRIPPRRSTQLTDSQRQAMIDYRREKVNQIYAGKTDYKTPQTSPILDSEVSHNLTRGDINSQNSKLEQSYNSNSQNYSLNSSKNYPGDSKKIISPLDSVTPKKQGAVKYSSASTQAKNHPAQINSAAQDQWRRYHAAWQNYYQKYYESYYTAALNQQKKAVANIQPELIENLSEDQRQKRALIKLRQNIAEKAREKSQKIRKSRHFMPIVSTGLVVAIFLFLQYNRLIFATVEAYVSPGNATAQETIQTPNSTISVGNDPKLIIPKINVDVPVVYGVGNDKKSQLDAMNRGVAHFAVPGANSVPGQAGNVVLSGHSSNDVFDTGAYKFIFAQLEKLEKGDVIYANYNGTRYSYVVRETEVVLPTEVSKVIKNDGKSWLTLITCTPLGTANKRLLVFAEQVSPDPESNKQAENTAEESSSAVELPRNSKTFFERLFTWDWS